MTPVEEIKQKDIDNTIDVNLKGTIYSVRQASEVHGEGR